MDGIDRGELMRWRAFFNIQPFGETAEWMRHGSLMSLIYNRTRGEKEKPLEPKDFLPS